MSISFGPCQLITEKTSNNIMYLATGNSFRSLAFSFRLGFRTVRCIVQETCVLIWTLLQPQFLPKPDADLWAKTADGYFSKWDFPNCIGSIDGKHIPLTKPPNSGSLYYNYKGFFSIVLLAVADAFGRLLVVDIGSYGSCSDGGIFSASCLGKRLCEGILDIPAAKKIPGTELITPHVFVADEAFALLPNLMKPFARRQLTTQKRVFNYRLSRARRQIECTFGILSNTWRIMKSIDTDVLPAIDSVKAICVLHNFLLAKEPNRIQIASDSDKDNRRTTGDTSARFTGSRNSTQQSATIRQTLCDYFNSPEGSLPWQLEACMH
ncbi:nuclease harbi1-like protein [Plakobranchus ocellatus]|uniref:Nuclease harbi1-like protein n=1 Tax=Plakobranchus ocellatus TaxID=259542 RepID=A0AAV3ZM71_9GAST|nr:nuclease harbi1-like protein [Plakobranchus ocellatus]